MSERRTDGITSLNLARTRSQIRSALGDLELDLRGAVVLTEAGSNAFAVAPILALAAGARVYALARESAYASVEEIRRQVAAVADAAGVATGGLTILTERRDVPDGIDIVTNLGSVRPVDAEILSRLSPSGVVSYMCEAWELRPGDVDISACDSLGVPVAGVWEDFGGMGVFSSCGTLAVKLCLDAGLEVTGNRILVVGADHFGRVVAAALRANLASVEHVPSADHLSPDMLRDADALVIADYLAEHGVVACGTGPGAATIAEWNPGLVVLQFVGGANAEELARSGVQVIPGHSVPPRRMGFTLSHLGSRPVVYLHAAGLKVGELLWRQRRSDTAFGRFAPLVQWIGGAVVER